MVQSIRIPVEDKRIIEDLANELGRSEERVATDLAIIGWRIELSGAGPRMQSPFGGPRPVAEVFFNRGLFETGVTQQEQISIDLTETEERKIQSAFGKGSRSATIRIAIKNGLIAVKPEAVEVSGVGSGVRPFAEWKIETDKIDKETMGMMLEYQLAAAKIED